MTIITDIGSIPEIKQILDDFRNQLKAEGFSDKRINYAINLAISWAVSQSQAFVPPEILEDRDNFIKVITWNLKKALQMARRWANSIPEK